MQNKCKYIGNYYQDFIELLQNYYEARRVKKQVFSIFFLKVEAVQQMQTIFIILIRIRSVSMPAFFEYKV